MGKTKMSVVLKYFPDDGQARPDSAPPRRMAKMRAPAGGMIAQNLFYPGGKMLPLEATGQAPKRMAGRSKADPLHGKTLFIEGAWGKVSDKPKRFAKAGDDLLAKEMKTVDHVGMSSPNVGTMGFDEAAKAMDGSTQVDHHRLIAESMAEMGIQPHEYTIMRGLGDYATPPSPTAENSAIHVVHKPLTREDSHRLGSLIGLGSNQHEILVFRPGGGEHTLHRLFIPRIGKTYMHQGKEVKMRMRDLADSIREYLDHPGFRDDLPFHLVHLPGIKYRTLVPSRSKTGDGYHVVAVTDSGDMDAIKVLDRLAKAAKSVRHSTDGEAIFLPGERKQQTRTHSRAGYRRMV